MTTRTLVLLRHAKAESPAALADLDRPLTARGHADAAAAGAWLAHQGYAPAAVLCSPARRTRETWHDVALALAETTEVNYDADVYDASTDDLLDLVRATDDAVGTLLVVGHNPALSQLSVLLDVAADPEGLRTAGLSVHTLDGSWADFAPDAAPSTETHTARA